MSYTFAAAGAKRMANYTKQKRTPTKIRTAKFCGKRSDNATKLAFAFSERHRASVGRDEVSYTFAVIRAESKIYQEENL